MIESNGGVIYKQKRVGRYNKDFKIFKFRTMYIGSDKKGLLTVGEKDSRITKTGFYLRKYKLDELPQLFNILIGEMSFVGPRPEVRKYVDLYNKEQIKVLLVRPGLTDYSSIEYINESEILKKSENPEQSYIEEIMPAKLELCLRYIKNKSFKTDLYILIKTLYKIVKK